MAFLVLLLNVSPAFSLAFEPLPLVFLAMLIASCMLSTRGLTAFSPICSFHKLLVMKGKSLLAPISSQSISRNEKAKFDTSKFPPVPIIVDTNWLRYCVFPYRTSAHIMAESYLLRIKAHTIRFCKDEAHSLFCHISSALSISPAKR